MTVPTSRVSEPGYVRGSDVNGEPGDLLIHFQGTLWGRAVVLDAFSFDELRPERPGHVLAQLVPEYLHMQIHGSGIRVNLDDRHLASVFVDEPVESYQSRFVLPDGFHYLLVDTREILEHALLDPDGRDGDERRGHDCFLSNPLQVPVTLPPPRS